jgi:hypothetical protein
MKFGSSRDLVIDSMHEEVCLGVSEAGESIRCRVTADALEALVSREGSRPEELLRIAHNYFDLLTEEWEQRIQLGLCELDGSVLLRRADVVPNEYATGARPVSVRRAFPAYE